MDRCLYNGTRVASDYQSIVSVEIVDNVHSLRINHTTMSIAGTYICEGSLAALKHSGQNQLPKWVSTIHFCIWHNELFHGWHRLSGSIHYITLHYIRLHHITLHYIASRHIRSHRLRIASALHRIASHHITSHHITCHYITLSLHYITLRDYATLRGHYITLHYMTLHYITCTLHYITLHYIT